MVEKQNGERTSFTKTSENIIWMADLLLMESFHGKIKSCQDPFVVHPHYKQNLSDKKVCNSVTSTSDDLLQRRVS